MDRVIGCVSTLQVCQAALRRAPDSLPRHCEPTGRANARFTSDLFLTTSAGHLKIVLALF
jgi:hypothetical protein